MEAVRNRLNVDSPTTVRWPSLVPYNAPYPTKLLISYLATQYPNYAPCMSLMCLGNELITFQLIVKWEDPESAVPLKLQFETSLNGINWDKVPGSEFTPDLDGLTFGLGDHSGLYSETFHVLTNAKYIRASVLYPGEGYDPTATVEMLCIQKEA
jgi:hypothetical protein